MKKKKAKSQPNMMLTYRKLEQLTSSPRVDSSGRSVTSTTNAATNAGDLQRQIDHKLDRLTTKLDYLATTIIQDHAMIIEIDEAIRNELEPPDEPRCCHCALM